jgi:hypothetical protein
MKEIEGRFRDAKDLRFGMGLASLHVSTPECLWLINAFAVVLLTLLGAAGEQRQDRAQLPRRHPPDRRAYLAQLRTGPNSHDGG